MPACEVPTVLQGGSGGHGGVLGQTGIDISGKSHQCCLFSLCWDHQKFAFSGKSYWPSAMCAIDYLPLLVSFLGPQNPTLSRCPFSLLLFPLCSHLSPGLFLFLEGWCSLGLSLSPPPISLSIYSLSHLTYLHGFHNPMYVPVTLQTYPSTCLCTFLL